MTDDAIAVLQCLFQTIWSLFTTWKIPGTNVTPAGWALFFLAAGIGFKYCMLILHRPPSGYGDVVRTAAFHGRERGYSGNELPPKR